MQLGMIIWPYRVCIEMTKVYKLSVYSSLVVRE